MDSLSQTLIAFNLAFCLFRSVAAIDSLTAQNPFLSDGLNGSSLVSRNGNFELGFFSPGLPIDRYLGIWFKNRRGPTSVWVANRENPINDTSGVLVMNVATGNLTLYSHNNTVVVWSARLLRKVPIGVLQLLDNGNLVLRDGEDANPQKYSWQSFDYPTDTLLPGMKLGWDLRNNIDRRLSAWKNPNDPSPGSLSWRMELHEYPETVMWNGTKEYFRHGPWNGVTITSWPLGLAPNLVLYFVSNEDEVYYQYTVRNESTDTVMLVLNQSTNVRTVYLWSATERKWTVYNSLPRDFCDNYALCGPFGYCDFRVVPSCNCLEGFKPRSPENWKAGEFVDGCERNKPMNCVDEVGFAQFNQMKLPDTTHTWVNRSMNLEECKQKCLRNCSCMAYANTNISGSGSGCALWIGDIIDLKIIPGAGQDLYVKMLASELVKNREAHKRLNPKVKIALVGIATALVLAILFICLYIFKKRSTFKDDHEKLEAEDLELPLFDLSLINSATNNFSLDNKLGEGGFGPVYKGKLTNGQDIAVKRLSKSSGQGMNEFKNEVIVTAKLQHRNLVKLLGCCIQGDEKMLVYEYMPNKSLDLFIFDETRRRLLNWSERYRIVCGIARGLAYLHQDSRLRIIHRDLKASNVLLDMDMNPKISDFGLAKTCGGDQTEGETIRVVGTYGYMAPEYAFDGQFSIKSDTFSYGILLLEIISGKRSRGFRHLNDQNLIGYAWQLWKGGNPAELIDDAIQETCNFSEVLRCINISLLCVQQHPNDRPTMSSVVMMLGCKIPLLQPKQPGFFAENEGIAMDGYLSKDKSASTSGLTLFAFSDTQ